MNLGPLISRELREQSRRVGTYWSRAGSALVVLGVMWLVWSAEDLSTGDGGRLLRRTHLVVCLLCWLGVPLLVADSISRERREGTLELLYLTPLSALEVVLAKLVAHGLAVVTMLIGLVPMVMIPVLLGGVDWKEALVSLLLWSSGIALAISAGLFASACNQRLTRALGWSMICTVMMASVLFILMGCYLWMAHGSLFRTYGPKIVFAFQAGMIWLSNSGTALELMDVVGMSQRWGRGAPRTLPALQWVQAGAVPLIFALVLSWVLIRLAAFQARPRREGGWLARCWHGVEPILGLRALPTEWLRTWQQSRLARNPIGWLEVRDWRSRLVLWLWVVVFILLATVELIGVDFGVSSRFVMAALFGLGLAGSAAGSLRRERESGFLELVLVSPMHPRQIIRGRLRAIYGRFVPAVGLLVWFWFYMQAGGYWEGFYPYGLLVDPWSWRWNRMLLGAWSGDPWFLATLFAEVFLVVPILGLFWSLRTKSFLPGFAMTVLLGLIVPFGIVTLLPLVDLVVLRGLRSDWSLYYYVSRGLVLGLYTLLGVASFRGLIRRMERRDLAGM